MYVILGATGQVGRVTANYLLSRDLPVRVVIRNPEKAAEWEAKNATTAIADLQDANALATAFHKAEAVFIMTPPLLNAADPMAEHDRMLTTLSTAINNSRPGRIVFLSSIGAQLPRGTGAIKKLYDMEQAFQKLAIPTIGIRAAWFMENFSHGLDYARQMGRLPSFLNPTNADIPMVATRDIGKLAAQLLQRNLAGHQTIELEGPCRYSADDVATIISSRFASNITAESIPEHLYTATYLSFGCTPAAAEMMAEMHHGFNSGHICFEENGQEHVNAETLLEDALNPPRLRRS